MPRRKIEPEILPPEDDQPKRKKMVEAEHTIKYTAPVAVVAEESAEDDEMVFDDGSGDEMEQRKRKPKNERTELKKRLALNHVTPSSQLKLSIEKYVHSDSASGGNWAETEWCTKYACVESHITNEDYLDVARKWGEGLYRFTLRMNNAILTAWDKRISPATTQTATVLQPSIPGDSSSPQILVQMPNNLQQPIAVADPMKQLKELLQMQKLMREALGSPESPAQQSQQSPAPLDPKIAALQLITENPDVMERIGKGIANTVLGKDARAADDWPSVIKEVALEAIKSGQAPQILGSLIREFMAPFKAAFQGGQQNGTSQMAPQAVSQVGGPDRQWPQSRQGDQSQSQQESAIGEEAIQGVGSDSQPVITPEEQVLALALDHCARQIPPQIAAQRVMQIADAINEQAPGMSIDGYLLMFAGMTPQAALEAAIHLTPNAGEVVTLSHAAQWTAELQALLKSQIGEEYAEEATNGN